MTEVSVCATFEMHGRPERFSERMSALEKGKFARLWRQRLEICEREIYTIYGAIDALRPLYYAYEEGTEPLGLNGSIASVGRFLNKRLNVLNEEKELCVQQWKMLSGLAKS